jgi:hypothetical protein
MINKINQTQPKPIPTVVEMDNQCRPVVPVVLNNCGGPASLGFPLNELYRVAERSNLPEPNELWLVSNGQVIGKITNIGHFFNLEPESDL